MVAVTWDGAKERRTALMSQSLLSPPLPALLSLLLPLPALPIKSNSNNSTSIEPLFYNSFPILKLRTLISFLDSFTSIKSFIQSNRSLNVSVLIFFFNKGTHCLCFYFERFVFKLMSRNGPTPFLSRAGVQQPSTLDLAS